MSIHRDDQHYMDRTVKATRVILATPVQTSNDPGDPGSDLPRACGRSDRAVSSVRARSPSMTPEEISSALTDIRTELTETDVLHPLMDLLERLSKEVQRISAELAALTNSLTDDGK